MTGKDIIKDLMEERGTTNVQLAEKLGITSATIWARLNNESDRDMQLYTFYEMVRALDYDIVIRPRKEKYVDGEERVVELHALSDIRKKGRPRKIKEEK